MLYVRARRRMQRQIMDQLALANRRNRRRCMCIVSRSDVLYTDPSRTCRVQTLDDTLLVKAAPYVHEHISIFDQLQGPVFCCFPLTTTGITLERAGWLKSLILSFVPSTVLMYFLRQVFPRNTKSTSSHRITALASARLQAG